ncbi:MAG TPA: putative ABC transporter permease [Candidatus Hydrogenedens sp.]|nr:putative ABC transporter permease [Candidatus Hydrogenedens sp.]HOL18931.1 putative ABC transporter permease [Candidatus Hydrogenedens sp.]HPP57569.1 putative ABC transporter permease [Candidatus Hydrogenedens sp.]
MDYHRSIVRFIIFALLGLVMEVFFTSFGGLIKHGEINLYGHTSPWMMIDYGLLGIITPWLRNPLKANKVPLPLRAFVYMIGIFFVEYVSGIIFHKVIGLKIWDYSHLRYNLHGQITLLYAPAWYALGLGVEKLYEWIDKASWAILTKSPEGYQPE